MLLWTSYFPVTNYGSFANDLERTVDGGFILVGTNRRYIGYDDLDLHLIKTDSAGSVLWSRIYSDSAIVDGMAVTELSDGGYVVACNRDSVIPGHGDVMLVRANATGDVVWTRTIGGDRDDRVTDMEMTSDGGFLIVGSTRSMGAGGDDVWLVRVNSEGDTLWTRAYGGVGDDVGTEVALLEDDGCAISAYTGSFGEGMLDEYVLRVSPTGDTLWTRTFGGASNDQANGIAVASDGGFVVAGSTRTFLTLGSTGDALMTKYSAAGAFMWSMHFVMGSSSARSEYYKVSDLFAVRRTTDNGYIVAGSYQYSGTYDNYAYAALAKLGAEVTSVASDGAVPVCAVLKQNFPNPFNPSTIIEFELPRAGHTTLKVFDMLGREVSVLADDDFPAGPHQVIFDAGNLPSGCYVYSIRSGTFVATRKLLLVR
jgi:hypothetical protein